ncbi:hypothetical protein G6F46_014770 [Rhizopus delemar]|nr:hypothetical protein G6F46_014770 [Rhizopus delemar]
MLVAAVIAGPDAGIRGGAGLAEAAGRQVRVLVEAGRTRGRAGIGGERVFVAGGTVDAAVVGQHEAARVEGDDLGLGGAGEGAEDEREEEACKAHCGAPAEDSARSRPPRPGRCEVGEAVAERGAADCGET